MSDRLTVESGETYRVPSGETHEWSGATVDGTIDVDGTLSLIDDPDTPGEPGFDIGIDSANIPLGLNLPMQPLNLSSMQMGVSVLLVGLLATMWGAIAWVRAYAAGVVLAFAMIALIMSGLLNIGLEVFWATIVLSLILLVAGVVVQWTR